MNFVNAIVRAGTRIALVPIGKVMGRQKANLLIATCNSFLNLRATLTDGISSRLTIGDGSAVLEIPRGSGGIGGSGAYRGNYDATAMYSFGDIVRTKVNTAPDLYIPWGCILNGTTGIAPVEGANWHSLVGGTWLNWKVCDDDGNVKQAWFMSTPMQDIA